MSIFDFLKKKNTNKNESLEDLCLISDKNRDDIWRQKAITAISKSMFEIGDPKIRKGPDGREYLNLACAANEFSKSKKATIKDLINQNIGSNFGMILNGNKETPDWVFSYGDIVDFYVSGEFYSNQFKTPFTGVVTDKTVNGIRLRIGQPSESFLPIESRKVIKEFLESFGLKPKIYLAIWVDDNSLRLIFNIVPELFENADPQIFKSLTHHLGWYLPRHYKIACMKEDDNFEPL